MMQNQLQRNLKDLKKEEQFEYILLVIFFNSVKSIYFNQFSCLICIQAVYVGPYQTMRWKNTLYRCWTSKSCTWTWRETAEFAWEWLFSVCCAHACQVVNHFGVNWPTARCENNDGIHFLSWNVNAIIGIISYYCLILNMIILHDAIETIHIQKNKTKNTN